VYGEGLYEEELKNQMIGYGVLLVTEFGIKVEEFEGFAK